MEQVFPISMGFHSGRVVVAYLGLALVSHLLNFGKVSWDWQVKALACDCGDRCQRLGLQVRQRRPGISCTPS